MIQNNETFKILPPDCARHASTATSLCGDKSVRVSEKGEILFLFAVVDAPKVGLYLVIEYSGISLCCVTICFGK